jgi:carbamate kinase
MVAHMKTTVDISDPLLESARQRAREQQRTLRELVEEGLRRVLAEDQPTKKFELREVPALQSELQPGIREGDWETIRDIIYGLK